VSIVASRPHATRTEAACCGVAAFGSCSIAHFSRRARPYRSLPPCVAKEAAAPASVTAPSGGMSPSRYSRCAKRLHSQMSSSTSFSGESRAREWHKRVSSKTPHT
jgi:hypothetical protein